MFGTDQIFLIRALNATRHSFFPTYVGLRLIAENLPSGPNSYLRRAIVRRLSVGDQWSFRQFQFFKSMGHAAGHAIPEYRNCVAPSPFAALAEALILAELASTPSFAAPMRSYSYLWPRSKWSGSSYEFFGEGYKRRNFEVAEALNAPNSVAVVTDIKGFYPSIRPGAVMLEMGRRLKSHTPIYGLTADAIEGFFQQLFNIGGSGLPIGPVSAHVLGHLALTDVDHELTAQYGKRYFRYVDDIIVVCDKSSAQATKKRIADCVSAQGYSLNADKTVVMTPSEWSSNVFGLDIAGDDDFRRYTHDLAVYLALHPDRKSGLSSLLSQAGLSIPIQRLAALSSYSRFRYFLSRRTATGGLPHAVGMVFAQNADFVDRAMKLKQKYEQSLDELLNDRFDSDPELRRWRVQRVRRVVNILFYLRRFHEWKSKLSVFEDFPELVEQHALAIALITNNANPILSFFPRGPAAFSELWSEHGEGEASVDANFNVDSYATLDSLATLSLTDTVSPQYLSLFGEEDRFRLLRVITHREVLSRTKPDLSYEDEFESLSLGVSREAMAKLTRTRYSFREGTTLDALTLLVSEYRS